MSDVNKVIFNGTTLVDLTGNTITENDLGYGLKSHDKAGNLITGTIPIRTASDVTVSNGYVTVPAGIYEADTTKSLSTS